MARATLAVAVLIVLALPASSSWIEETATSIVGPEGTYQEDAGVPGDAPATCETVDLARQVVVGAEDQAGMLVEYDDEADAYAYILDQTHVGDRLFVAVDLGILTDRYDVAFDVLAPGCGASVLDAESSYYPQPPADPYDPAPGSLAYSANTVPSSCNGSEWKFHVNKIQMSSAPADIYVEWTNGDYAYVPLSKASQGTVGMYLTTANLDYTIARAVIVLPITWQGEFKVAHGPCDAIEGDGGAAPPIVEAGYAEFTVQQAGTHVIVVSISRSTVDKTTDTVNDLVMDPPTAIPVHCHDICSLALTGISYDLGSAPAS